MKEELRATCPFCSLHCADLRLMTDEGRLARLSPRCELARRGYARAFQAIIDGIKPSIPKKEIIEALSILQSARKLLVVLSGDAPNEAVGSALRIVRKYNGVLTVEDEALTNLNTGMKEVGCLSATLGELKEMETLLICAAQSNLTYSRQVDFLGKNAMEHSIVINPNDTYETLRRLRLALADEKTETMGEFQKKVEPIRSVSTGVVLIESSCLQAGEPVAREFLLLLQDLNRFGRWYAQYLPCGANSVGVAESLLSSVGITGGLNVGEEIEETAPRRWQTMRLIEEGWIDACLLVGNPRSLQGEMIPLFQSVNTVLIDPIAPTWKPTVWLPVAQTGVDASGSMARLDGVPVWMEQLIDTGRVPIQTLLDGLIEGRGSL